MPSPFIILSATTLAQLNTALNDRLFDDFVQQNLWTTRRENGDIAVSLDCLNHDPKLAPAFGDLVHVLLFCHAPSVLHRPQPRPDDLVFFLLDTISTILMERGDFTGHERMEILEAIEEAKFSKGTPLSKACPQLPGNERQERLRVTAQRLAANFKAELQVLDRQFASYRRAVAGTCLEGTVAMLGLQGELADALLIGTERAEDGAPRAILAPSPQPSRGTGYRAAMQAVDVLFAYAQGVMPGYFMGPRPVGWSLVQNLHAMMFEDLLSPEKSGRARRTEMMIRTHQPDMSPVFALAPQQIEQAMVDWSDDFALTRWVDVPCLVRVALAHLAFERIHPFSDGNGRVGRMAMLFQMLQQGLPALPLELVCYRRREAYLAAVGDALAHNRPECFLHFLVSACREAAYVGQQLLKTLRPIHRPLVKRIGAVPHPPQHVPYIAGKLLARSLLFQDDFKIIFNRDPQSVVPLLEGHGLLQPVWPNGRRMWFIAAVMDVLRSPPQ